MGWKEKIDTAVKSLGNMNRYSTSGLNVDLPSKDGVRYGGFIKRLYASGFDSIVAMLILFPITLYVFTVNPLPYDPNWATSTALFAEGKITASQLVVRNEDYIRNEAVPFFVKRSLRDAVLITALILAFWFVKSTTPGKMIFGLKIVDENTFEKPKTWQFIVRYLGYIVSTIPFGLGFIWVAFDKKKRGFHDLLSRTVVIYNKSLDPDWQKKAFKRQSYLMVAVLLIFAIIWWVKNN